MNDDTKEKMQQVTDELAQKLVDPPSIKGAASICAQMEKLYVSAIAGLFNNTVHTQKGLDNAYELVDSAAEMLKERLHEVLYIIANGYDLKPKDISDVNKMVYHEIMKELNKDGMGN